MILDICDSPNMMQTMNIVMTIINIIIIVVPILLLFSLMFKLINASVKNNQDALKDVKKKAIPNIITAFLIFIVPTFINLIVTVSFPESDYTKCAVIVPKETIRIAFEEKAEELVTRAEKSLNMSDYTSAKNYLINIDNDEVRENFENRLKIVKELINKNRQASEIYSTVEYDDFKWIYYQNEKGPAKSKYDEIMNYAIWAPENKKSLNGVSLPLIVWLHGEEELIYKLAETSGKTSDKFLKSNFLDTISNWKSFNLSSIPAIIVAPHSDSGWTTEHEYKSIKALIEYYSEEYNINPSRVVLMGHSTGGRGVIHTSYNMQQMFSKNYFYALVPMSSNVTEAYPTEDTNKGYEYFSNMKIRSYSEDKDADGFNKWLGKKNDFIYLKDVKHNDVPKVALTTDSDKDGVSDLMYWLFGDAAKIVKPTPEDDGTGLPGLPGGDDVQIPPGPRPITNYLNVSALNSYIASAAKSGGLYTRNGVVSVAKALISYTEGHGYYVPYQLGGMYHRGNLWGANPNWGTVIVHNNKQVLSGLDCRNFVHWTFKQAGLSLVRGFGYEGSKVNDGDNRYSDISQGRPGDVIDAAPHLMLIVSNNGDSYTVAEANGVGRVRLHTFTYNDLRRAGYMPYNMDAVYNNTGKYCPSTSGYKAYPGSCHIPKDQFPAYYGFGTTSRTPISILKSPKRTDGVKFDMIE